MWSRPCPRNEAYTGSSDKAPPILNVRTAGGEWSIHAQTALYPVNNPNINWIGGRVGCSAGLDVWEWILSQNVWPVAQSLNPLRHSDSH